MLFWVVKTHQKNKKYNLIVSFTWIHFDIFFLSSYTMYYNRLSLTLYISLLFTSAIESKTTRKKPNRFTILLFCMCFFFSFCFSFGIHPMHACSEFQINVTKKNQMFVSRFSYFFHNSNVHFREKDMRTHKWRIRKSVLRWNKIFHRKHVYSHSYSGQKVQRS